MANDSTRAALLSDQLIEAGVPIDGISVIDIRATPPAIEVQYAATITEEQRALGDQVVAGFDWRRRRVLDRNTVVAAFQALTPTQRQTLQAHLLCQFARDNPRLAAKIAQFTGAPLVVDEVDPT
jgi:hypothetical protein